MSSIQVDETVLVSASPPAYCQCHRCHNGHRSIMTGITVNKAELPLYCNMFVDVENQTEKLTWVFYAIFMDTVLVTQR